MLGKSVCFVACFWIFKNIYIIFPIIRIGQIFVSVLKILYRSGSTIDVNVCVDGLDNNVRNKTNLASHESSHFEGLLSQQQRNLT